MLIIAVIPSSVGRCSMKRREGRFEPLEPGGNGRAHDYRHDSGLVPAVADLTADRPVLGRFSQRNSRHPAPQWGALFLLLTY